MDLKAYTFYWLCVNIVTVFHPGGLTFVLGAQRESLIETVLLSTHSTCLITTHLKI